MLSVPIQAHQKKHKSVLFLRVLSVPIQARQKRNADSVSFFLRVLRNLYPCRTVVRRHVVLLFHCFIAIFSMLADFMDLICKIG